MERNLSMEMAKVIAEGAIEQCQKDGYRVTVAVVDRAGQLRVLRRGDSTSPHTIEMARRKAFTARAFRQTTIEFAKRTESGPAPALRNVTDVIAAGSPCANAGITKVADQLK